MRKKDIEYSFTKDIENKVSNEFLIKLIKSHLEKIKDEFLNKSKKIIIEKLLDNPSQNNSANTESY